MMNLKCSGFAKALAVIMSAFMLLLSVVSVWALMFAIYSKVYVKPFDLVYEDLMSEVVRGELYSVCYAHQNGEAIPKVSENVYYQMYSYGNSTERVSNYIDGDFNSLSTEHGAYHVTVTYYFGNINGEPETEYFFDVYVLSESDVYNDISVVSDLVVFFYSVRYWLIVIAVFAVTLTILFYVFAISGAGYRRDAEGTVRGWFDFIPFDILIFLTLILASAEIMIWDEWTWSYDELVLLVLAATYIFIDSMVMSVLSMTFVVRIKTKTFVSNNLTTYIIKTVYRICKAVGKLIWRGILVSFSALRGMIREIPTFWRGVLFWCVGMPLFAFLNVVLAIEASHDEFFFLFIILLWIAVIGFGVWRSWNLARVKNGAKKIAAGDLEHKLSTDFMFFDYKKCADYLNSINSGMAFAIEERMKGERFKTELITNVSHDIKTPITSIINYVDLLKKSDIQDETLRGYIDVLDRQSARLKKLTGDLIEASKASSGVIEVHPENIELGIFLSQAAGEYEERLSAAGLSLMTSFPEEDVNIYADGKLMWRIIDNLMSNVCKYSLPGTRVYLSLSMKGTDAVISLNNISREPINIDGDELTERFVRGDMSRHTEGSGLGLSIAKSLTELQGGKMIIFTDSDLFKVTVRMKLVDWGSIEPSAEPELTLE